MHTFLDDQTHPLPSDADPELLRDFASQMMDLVESAEQNCLALEARPDDDESVNACMRVLHTVKGTSASLQFPAISGLTHQMEALLAGVRRRELPCTPDIVGLLLASLDMIKALLKDVSTAFSRGHTLIPAGYCELVRRLAQPQVLSTPDRHDYTAVIGDGMSHREAFLRVRLDRLDNLIDMIGELGIAYSLVAHDPLVNNCAHHDLLRKALRVTKILREVQDLSMTLRMVPLRGLFQKLSRVARDVASQTRKSVNFVAEGEDTELDRSVIEMLLDPLVHMVRNAIDHGIEDEVVRAGSGKPQAGTVRLTAQSCGRMVLIELADDGRGLDLDHIRRRAVALKLLQPEQRPTDQELLEWIFSPGFSTADRVTEVSGRGVGLDVVKRQVEALRGVVSVSFTAGQGSVFRIGLPLTRTITDGMIVHVGTERFIVPLSSLVMIFRPARASLTTVAGRGELVQLQGDLVPLYRLHRLYGIEGAKEDATQGLLIVVGEGTTRCALLVDGIIGQQSVVAKPLGSLSEEGFSGGAILGDGRVGLILNPTAIVLMASTASSREHATS